MSQDQDNRTLNLYPIDYPFETLVDRINKSKLRLNPDFQRKYKWDREGWERASKFIESCLMRIPLPSCYFAEIEDNSHIVIDGVQRLTTILRFFAGDFALEGLTTYKELEGKKFSELGDYGAALEATTIRCIVLRKENPKRLIREIFSRLNQGAVALSDQEIRHAIFPGPFDDLLCELAQLDPIKNFGKGPNSKSEKDSRESEEQVLRYFAFLEQRGQYDDRLSRFLDTYMEAHADAGPDEILASREKFKKSLANCILVFGDDVFKGMTKDRQRQSMVYYDLLMYSLGSLDDVTITTKKGEIIKAFSELCNSSDFRKTISGGLQQKSAIGKRREIWRKLLERALR